MSELLVTIGRVKDWETARSVSGVLLIENVFECYTLEPARTNPVNPGHPCIDAGGPFEVVINKSPHLGYDTPLVLDVPGRSEIRWHIANKPEDLLGCVGVGEYRATDWVGNSKIAFEQLMVKLKDNIITAVYRDNFNLESITRIV